MKLLSVAAAAVLAALAVAVGAVSDNLTDLVQVHILMSHGQRAPVWRFPGDTADNSSNWPRGYGHLVTRGLQQQSNLGRWLRNRYSTLLGDYGFPHYQDFHVVSADAERCIDSATATLASLFPTKPAMQYEKNFNFTPVPVHSIPADVDTLLDVGAACPGLKTCMEKDFYGSEFAKSFLGSNSRMVRDLEHALDTTVENVESLHRIYDTFKIRKNANLSVPPVFTTYEAKLEELENWYYSHIASTDCLKTLRGGGGRLLTETALKIELNHGHPKLLMYAADASAVATNLDTLGLFNGQPPPYAAAVVYEVFSSSDSINIKVLYQNDTAGTSISSEGHYLATYTLDQFNNSTIPYSDILDLMCNAAPSLRPPLPLLLLLAKVSLFTNLFD